MILKMVMSNNIESKHNWKLIISNSYKTRYNVCNKHDSKVYAETKPDTLTSNQESSSLSKRNLGDYGIWYKPIKNSELIGYSDSDWAGCIDDMKSTSGYVFSLGNGVFSWLSQKQDTVAQSTAEVGYIAVCAAAKQAIWLRRILADRNG